MGNYKNVLYILLWILIENVVQTSAATCYNYSYGYYYYCSSYYYSGSSSTSLPIGTIAGAVVGALIGIVVLIVIVAVVCNACKHSGNRGTVVQPVNTTNAGVHTVHMNQPPPLQYNQYPPPAQYNQYPPPPPPTMGEMGPGPANANHPPTYSGVVQPTPGGNPPTK